MRLTLRTLLAYLDSTLDPEDGEALRVKIEASAFATELVRRIRAAATASDVTAPAPDAAGPLEDANVMAEYLDSTLTPEQIAEIERACLESDHSLAEAAACHQILTMVLSNQATFDDSLRERIYQLPSQMDSASPASSTAVSGSFAAVDIPDDPLGPSMDVPGESDLSETGRFEEGGLAGAALGSGLADVTPTGSMIVEEGAGPLDARSGIRPVGPNDSGVSDAPTRIRDLADSVMSPGNESTYAGSGPRSVAKEYYAGDVRPSRITPWLVSLGIVALLMFALSKAFEPLLARRTAQQTEQAQPIPDPATLPGSADTASIPSDGNSSDTIEPDAEQPSETAVAVTPDVKEPKPASPAPENLDNGSPQQPIVENTESVADSTMTPADLEAAMPSTESTANVALGSGADDSVPIEDAPATSDSTTGTPVETVNTDLESTEGPTTGSAAPMLDPSFVEAPEKETPPEESIPTGAVAKVTEKQTLLGLLSDDEAVPNRRLQGGQEVAAGSTLVAPPYFRPSVETLSGALVSLIGPCRASVSRDESGDPLMRLVYGAILVRTGEPDSVTMVDVDDTRLLIRVDNADTSFVVRKSARRLPGMDPLAPENLSTSILVMSVDGEVQVKTQRKTVRSVPEMDETNPTAGPTDSDSEAVADSGPGEIPSEPTIEYVDVGDAIELHPSMAVELSAGVEPVALPVPELPPWSNPETETFSAVQQSARDVILAILGTGDDLTESLRDAIPFRRSEVGALAAQFLLGLDQPEVFFGADGILNTGSQKRHWETHFRMLQTYINSDVSHAQRMMDAIAKMESANMAPLSVLLLGYSPQGLEQGGDQQLVDWLDSPVMAVRVLALENLRMITGSSGYFDPAETIESRRLNDVRKWQVRLKRGQIRYGDPANQ